MDKFHSKASILIVDDDYGIRRKLETLLKSNDFNAISFENGKDALDELEKNDKEHYNLILLDISLSDESGFNTARKIKSNERLKDIPIIFITGSNDLEDKRTGFSLGCVDYIAKPFDNAEVILRIKLHLELAVRREEAVLYAHVLEDKIKERTLEILNTRKALIVSLASLSESRDNETGAHIFRTQEYSKILAEELRKTVKYSTVITNNFVENMYDCSPLHDIGKVGIADHILLKPGKLTIEEFEIMKSHCYIGKKTLETGIAMLGKSEFFNFASDIIYTHHEKYDGSGYPEGLKGETIPLNGRIMAVSDVYDALTTKRTYKDAWSHEKARDLMIEQAGKHFDPDIIQAFLAAQNSFIDSKNKFKEFE